MYRMNFNKVGPIDPKLFKMCEEAHYYQESFKIDSLISEPDLFKMAEELGNYFEMEALVNEMEKLTLA